MEHKKIELRENDDIQDFVGDVPTGLLKWGMIVIAGVVCILLCGGYFFRYPETVAGEIVIPNSEGKDSIYGDMYLAPSNIGEIKPGMTVNVALENFSSSRYGILKGSVAHIYGIPGENGRFHVRVGFKDDFTTVQGYKLPRTMFMVGQGKVILNDRSFLEIIFERLR